jgi:hypothetical protein
MVFMALGALKNITPVKKSELEIAVVVEFVDIRRIFKNSPNSRRILNFFLK